MDDINWPFKYQRNYGTTNPHECISYFVKEFTWSGRQVSATRRCHQYAVHSAASTESTETNYNWTGHFRQSHFGSQFRWWIVQLRANENQRFLFVLPCPTTLVRQNQLLGSVYLFIFRYDFVLFTRLFTAISRRKNLLALTHTHSLKCKWMNDRKMTETETDRRFIVHTPQQIAFIFQFLCTVAGSDLIMYYLLLLAIMPCCHYRRT